MTNVYGHVSTFAIKIQKIKAVLQNKVGGLTLLDYKTYYKVAVGIMTVWYGQKNRHIDQWNGTESLEIGPHKYHQSIFDRGANFTLMGAGYTCILKTYSWALFLDIGELLEENCIFLVFAFRLD